jgi:hypothetical protein
VFDVGPAIVGVEPIPPAQTRKALVALLGAHLAAHGRLPSKSAVRDVVNQLGGEPRSELSADEWRCDNQRRYRARLRGDGAATGEKASA